MNFSNYELLTNEEFNRSNLQATAADEDANNKCFEKYL